MCRVSLNTYEFKSIDIVTYRMGLESVWVTVGWVLGLCSCVMGWDEMYGLMISLRLGLDKFRVLKA